MGNYPSSSTSEDDNKPQEVLEDNDPFNLLKVKELSIYSLSAIHVTSYAAGLSVEQLTHLTEAYFEVRNYLSLLRTGVERAGCSPELKDGTKNTEDFHPMFHDRDENLDPKTRVLALLSNLWYSRLWDTTLAEGYMKQGYPLRTVHKYYLLQFMNCDPGLYEHPAVETLWDEKGRWYIELEEFEPPTKFNGPVQLERADRPNYQYEPRPNNPIFNTQAAPQKSDSLPAASYPVSNPTRFPSELTPEVFWGMLQLYWIANCERLLDSFVRLKRAEKLIRCIERIRSAFVNFNQACGFLLPEHAMHHLWVPRDPLNCPDGDEIKDARARNGVLWAWQTYLKSVHALPGFDWVFCHYVSQYCSAIELDSEYVASIYGKAQYLQRAWEPPAHCDTTVKELLNEIATCVLKEDKVVNLKDHFDLDRWAETGFEYARETSPCGPTIARTAKITSLDDFREQNSHLMDCIIFLGQVLVAEHCDAEQQKSHQAFDAGYINEIDTFLSISYLFYAIDAVRTAATRLIDGAGDDILKHDAGHLLMHTFGLGNDKSKDAERKLEYLVEELTPAEKSNIWMWFAEQYGYISGTDCSTRGPNTLYGVMRTRIAIQISNDTKGRRVAPMRTFTRNTRGRAAARTSAPVADASKTDSPYLAWARTPMAERRKQLQDKRKKRYRPYPKVIPKKTEDGTGTK